jgi:hypothetical protein
MSPPAECADPVKVSVRALYQPRVIFRPTPPVKMQVPSS